MFVLSVVQFVSLLHVHLVYKMKINFLFFYIFFLFFVLLLACDINATQTDTKVVSAFLVCDKQ
jgi:hypothetical protein